MLALFDLDHTLLAGDSDVLWCEFLMDQGVLDRTEFDARNRAIEAGYKAGSVGVLEFCEFFLGTLAGHTAAHWLPLREQCLHTRIQPRLLPQGIAAVEAHRAAGHRLVMSTATSRFLAERTAQVLDFTHLIATEAEHDEAGRFTGRVAGLPNMREGKVARLQAWLAQQALPGLAQHHSVFYSDSMNDLALLSAVDEAVVVNGDQRLKAVARERGWRMVDWA
ncbi:MAG: HAD-IB family hydrolase [Rubrivivax sp.]|nr:HAD-IB family hydrolase [Rubrivivax sp.]